MDINFIGDLKNEYTLIDNIGGKWLVFDYTEKFIHVVDMDTQRINGVCGVADNFTIELKPHNVEYLFLKRREYAYKGLERFV